MAAEGGANACPRKAAGKGGSASPGATLEGGYASGTAIDWFAQVKEPSAEPATAAEGVVRAGESTAAHGGQVGDAQPSAFSMNIQLRQYLVFPPPTPPIRPFHAVYIIVFDKCK